MESQPSSKEMVKRHSGRPKLEINWEKVGQWIMAGATATQVAASIGVSPDTLYTRCKQDLKQDFTAFCQEKRAEGERLINNTQFEVACKNKNVTMLIWLGKQRCGQRDHDLETIKTSKEDAARVDALMDQIKQLQEALTAKNPVSPEKSEENIEETDNHNG